MPLPRIDLSRLHEQLGGLFASPNPQKQILHTFLQFTLALVNGSAAVLHLTAADALKAHESLLSRQAESWSDNLQEEMAVNASQAVAENKARLAPLRRTPAATILSVPFNRAVGSADGCLSVVLLPGNQALEIFVALLQLLAINLGMWLQKGTGGSEHLGPATRLALLAIEALEEGKKELAASLFAARLRELLQADTVIVSVCPAGKAPKPMAISSLADFNRQSPAALLIQQVLTECQMHGKALLWPVTTSAEVIASPILRGLASEYDAGQAYSLPLFDKGADSSGVLIVLWHDLAPELHTNQLELLAASARILGSFARWLSPQEKSLTGRFTRLPRGQKLAMGSALLLAIILLCCLPVAHTISADCLLMPRTSRYVVAQFDGILQKVDKELGAVVKTGEKIASLEGQSIDLEISSLQAEIGKSRKLQDVAMVAGQTASAQIARLEGERLAEKLKILQLQSTMLTIESPVDGVIISGAVEKAEGGPVRKGQTLFEIAPLARMIVEMHIRQEDFQYVSVESPVQIKLDAYPGRIWTGRINSIHPKTEPREAGFVFLAQCFLDNPEGDLQPGMNGTARISAGRRPLLWVVLKKPWIALQKIFR